MVYFERKVCWKWVAVPNIVGQAEKEGPLVEFS
jgi:hypothetical protein